jgi:HD-like signal output (HDOD) protein/chemotaxis receptor (MCP) glutamine deamidase CheD
MTLPKKVFVESGSYAISGVNPLIYQAVLGSCVGVAIVDKKAKIGGLYHILLPEPTSKSTPFQEEIYASSGMPKFLQALGEAGCALERMEATLAGGALIGRLSHLDMHLNIGGRTLEVVQRILHESDISVVQSETGGFFGTMLQLDLRTLKFRIDTAYPHNVTGKAVVGKISKEELTRAIDHVAPIPQMVLKIIRIFESGNYSLKDITKLIRQDQIISGRVIKICNSPYVAATKHVKSIEQAIVILGARLIVHLVLTSALESFLEGSRGGYSMSKGAMFRHAISTAIVSERISRMTGKSEPDIAYTAGLLHDIGKVALDQWVRSAMPEFYRQIYADGQELRAVEKSLLGITHAEAGERLAELWSFPAGLKDAIAFHDQPELAENDPDLTHIVYLADLLISRFDTCHEMERIGTEKRLGLNQNLLSDLISSIPWKYFNNPTYF